MGHRKSSRRTPRRFGRRLFLTGAAGVTVGLPWLESIRPRGAKAAGPDDPGFVVFVRQGNGCAQAGQFYIEDNSGNIMELNEPERFWPRALGPLSYGSMDADSDRATSELKDYADKLLIVRGVNLAFRSGGCGHARGALQALTAATSWDSNITQNSLAAGESLDNRVARELNPGGRGPLTLAAMRPYQYLDSVLSYRGPGDRRGAQTNPKVAFDEIMGLVNLDDTTADALATKRQSVNDLVREQMQGLLSQNRLSQDDRQRLDQHFSSIRDLEIRLEGCTPLDNATVNAIQNISGQHEQEARVVETSELHADVIALGIACGYTHAATLQVGNGNDQTQYTVNGERLTHFHQISHRIDSDGGVGNPIPRAQEQHAAIDRIHARIFKHLLDRISAYTTDNGTLLDDGVCVWMNDLANGPEHSGDNMPYVLAGGAKNALRTGVYVDAGSVTHNRFLNTIATAVGLRKGDGSPVDDFGDPSLQRGLIDQMTV